DEAVPGLALAAPAEPPGGAPPALLTDERPPRLRHRSSPELRPPYPTARTPDRPGATNFRRAILALALLAGCSAEDPGERGPLDLGSGLEADVDVDDDHDLDAGIDVDLDPHTAELPDAPSGGGLSAVCERQPDNALRVDCEVTVSPP